MNTTGVAVSGMVVARPEWDIDAVDSAVRDANPASVT